MFLSVDKKLDCYLFSFKIISNYNKGYSLESTYSITLDCYENKILFQDDKNMHRIITHTCEYDVILSLLVQ